MRDPDDTEHQPDGEHSSHHGGSTTRTYLRFAAMILTAMVVMYATMFAGTWEWGHVRFSQSRVFMAVTMGGTMGLVMLAWMLHMYRDAKANAVVVVVSLLLLGGGVALDRTQATVGDVAYMDAMIPHHSLAITRSERAQIEDPRVCALAVEIIEAQQREIAEMDWLVDDIRSNGLATAADVDDRPVPAFEGDAGLTCTTP